MDMAITVLTQVPATSANFYFSFQVHMLWLFSSVHAFSYTETQVVLSLFDNFKMDYLDLLDEDLEASSIVNSSFPPRNLVMTAVVTPEELVTRLRGFSGMTLVAARADRTAWFRFVKVF